MQAQILLDLLEKYIKYNIERTQTRRKISIHVGVLYLITVEVKYTLDTGINSNQPMTFTSLEKTDNIITVFPHIVFA